MIPSSGPFLYGSILMYQLILFLRFFNSLTPK